MTNRLDPASPDAPLADAVRPARSRVRFQVLAFTVVLAAVTYLDRVCIAQTAGDVKRDLGLSDVQMGYVFSAFTLAYALFEMPSGAWGDRIGTRRVLTRIVVWWSFFTALTGAANGLVMLLIVRFLFGAGEAGALPNAARVLRVWFPDSNRARAQSVIATSMLLGGTIAPVASQAMINVLGWRGTFGVFGLVGVVWAIAFYAWFRDDPGTHPAVNDAERSLIAKGRAADR